MTFLTAAAEYERIDRPGTDARRSRPENLASAGAAHDLGNYLQVICSAVRIIERSLSVEARAALEPVVRGAHVSLERATCLTRQVASDRSRRRPRKVAFSPAARLATLQPVIDLALGASVLLEYRLDNDAPDVSCDGDALDDAVMNLVVNARRAMPGGGRLSVCVARGSGSHDGLPGTLIRIADTGCGMSPEMVARAFEPGVTSKADNTGTGLGLATVAAFAKAAGGSASVDSRLGVGTVVTIALPGVLKAAKGSRPRVHDADHDD